MTYIDVEPRGRRAIVCPYLRMDGTLATVDRIADAKIIKYTPDGFVQFFVGAVSRHDWNCGAESLHVPNHGYVRDVCTSSDSKGCPFLPLDFVPVPVAARVLQPPKRPALARKPYTRLSDAQTLAIRARLATGERVTALAREFGVNQGTIAYIRDSKRKVQGEV